MTIDQSSLDVSPGARATSVTFTANLRSSRGGLHALTLPEGAALQNVTVNGVQQPIRQEGRVVSIPLIPGSQSIKLEWRETEGMGFTWRTPEFDIGTPTVNADVEVRVPNDRWVLFVRGPGLGPAVLFWSFLLVLLAVSIALARTKYTPLSTVQWVLLALGLSQVPVVDGKGHPVGMVHEVDVLRGMQAGEVTPTSPAKAVCHPIGGLIYPKARIEELFRIFETDQVGVVVDNGKIVGIVSKVDVLEFMTRR